MTEQPQELDTTEHQMKGLLRVLTRLRDLHPDMTVLQAMCLAYIAAKPGMTQRELYRHLGSNDSVASRTVALLSDIGNRGTPGFDLVRMDVDPADRRQRLLSLTPKGCRFAKDLAQDIVR